MPKAQWRLAIASIFSLYLSSSFLLIFKTTYIPNSHRRILLLINHIPTYRTSSRYKKSFNSNSRPSVQLERFIHSLIMYPYLILGTMLLMAIIVTTAPVAVPAVISSDSTTSVLADQLDSELTFQPLPAIIIPLIPDTTLEPVVSVASSESYPLQGNNATSHEPIQSVKRGNR